MTSLTVPDRGSRSGNLASERRRYQQRVGVLLETVTHGVENLERLRARGLRGRALAEHEADLLAARRELAALVDSRERNRVPAPDAEDACTGPRSRRTRPKPPWAPVHQMRMTPREEAKRRRSDVVTAPLHQPSCSEQLQSLPS